MDSDSSHTIEVTVEALAWHAAVTDPERICRQAVAAVLARELPTGEDAGEVSVLLTDDDAVAELNATWRGRTGPTNVLSFPGEEGDAPMAPGQPRLLGDIAVALETVLREAAAEGKSAAHHLSHLVVHGTLHLLGYDHEEETEALRMEAREVEILAGLGVRDPYHAEAAA